MFSRIIENLYSSLSKVSLDALVWTAVAGYLVVFFAALFLTIKKEHFRARSKKPFLHFTNAFAAVILALFLTANGLGESVVAALIFWCIGYLLYGALCFASSRGARSQKVIIAQTAVSSMPTSSPSPAPARAGSGAPAVKNNVRLEHAISITEKLLQKNLSKSDRQEVEKLKNTLAVLQIKGTLSPSETEILNENFNTLLKLMAKYNV